MVRSSVHLESWVPDIRSATNEEEQSEVRLSCDFEDTDGAGVFVFEDV